MVIMMMSGKATENGLWVMRPLIITIKAIGVPIARLPTKAPLLTSLSTSGMRYRRL